jgi:hypothetical protein
MVVCPQLHVRGLAPAGMFGPFSSSPGTGPVVDTLSKRGPLSVANSHVCKALGIVDQVVEVTGCCPVLHGLHAGACGTGVKKRSDEMRLRGLSKRKRRIVLYEAIFLSGARCDLVEGHHLNWVAYIWFPCEDCGRAINVQG